MGETRRKLTNNEKIVGDLMRNSFNTYAQASGSQTVDVTDLLEMMETMEKEGNKVSTTAIFIKAIAIAMESKEHPENKLLNCRIEGDEIIFYDDVNVGVGVNTANGLMIIVIKKAQEKSLLEIADEVKDKVIRANKCKLSLDDIQGGTITISNLCKTKAEVFSSVITGDQAVIMGFGAIKKGVMVKNNEIVIRDVMHVMQNVNHTACSGSRAATMFGDVCDVLEHPELLLK